MREHLFISYATEDWPFVEWLSLRLTAEGYRVWCDRFNLLGGESYPRNIDDSIKNGTFRFVAVLSHNSIQKTNPVKERTLALNLARARKEDFVIPINLDGISVTDLDWMFSDLTYIPFHLSWAEGLAQLLKKLEKLQTPKREQDSRSLAASWYESRELVVKKHERLWANLAQITELPKDIYRYELVSQISDEELVELAKTWPHFSEDSMFWSFLPVPIAHARRFAERRGLPDWANETKLENKIRARRLFNASLKTLCLSRGLSLTADGKICYFPDGLLPSNRLWFVGYDNKRTWLRTVGIRNFKRLTGTESCRYHLAPYFRVWPDYCGMAVLFAKIRLVITTLDGKELPFKAVLSRRKRICKNWWNSAWLARTLGVLQHLAAGNEAIHIGMSSPQRMVISPLPISLDIEHGLDESKLKDPEYVASDADEEEALIEDDDESEEGENKAGEQDES